ncbi:MAG: hypothetical protein KIT09_02145 [Bryobacteraceae bacterium]|nr:hypothetical protein [Bryobacteraceae bacterium]
MKNAIRKVLEDLPDEALVELATQAGELVEQRRERFALERIKFGMSKQDVADAHAEIRRVMREMERGR